MTTPAPDPLDELFAVPLADFVKTRDRQAADLRKQGDKARAAEIKALAKPTPAAWAVNQAARISPQGMKSLLEASDRVARLQLRAGADPDSRRRFEEASAEHRRTMAELVELSARALREAGHADTPAALERVSNNLRWGALDEDARPLLTQGRMQRDLTPQGFGAFTGPASDEEEAAEEATIDLGRGRSAPAAAPTRPTSKPPSGPSAGERPRLVSIPPEPPEPPANRAETGVLRAHLREAEKQLKQTERELERRSTAVREAKEILSDLERRASSAREVLRAAEEACAETEGRFAEEEATRQAAADALERALHPLPPVHSARSEARPSDPGKRGR